MQRIVDRSEATAGLKRCPQMVAIYLVYCIVARVDGDHAWLVAPAKGSGATAVKETDDGTKLKYEMLQCEVIQD